MNLTGSKIDGTRIDGSLDKLFRDLEKIRDMGAKAVELPIHGLDAIFNGKLRRERLEKIVNILGNFEFQYSIHSPNPLNLMDMDLPELHKDVLLATLEFARIIRAKIVVLHPGRFLPEERFFIYPVKNPNLSQKKKMLEKEAVILQSAARQYPDIFIALENARPYLDLSPYTYAESIQELKTQVININRENVKINLDFGHLYMTSVFYQYDLMDAVIDIRDLVVHTHVHDNFGRAVHHYEKIQTHQLPFGRGDSHMPPGFGDLPIKKIIKTLLPDYKGMFMLELRSRYFNDIKESCNKIKSIVDQCF